MKKTLIFISFLIALVISLEVNLNLAVDELKKDLSESDSTNKSGTSDFSPLTTNSSNLTAVETSFRTSIKNRYKLLNSTRNELSQEYWDALSNGDLLSLLRESLDRLDAGETDYMLATIMVLTECQNVSTNIDGTSSDYKEQVHFINKQYIEENMQSTELEQSMELLNVKANRRNNITTSCDKISQKLSNKAIVTRYLAAKLGVEAFANDFIRDSSNSSLINNEIKEDLKPEKKDFSLALRDGSSEDIRLAYNQLKNTDSMNYSDFQSCLYSAKCKEIIGEDEYNQTLLKGAEAGYESMIDKKIEDSQSMAEKYTWLTYKRQLNQFGCYGFQLDISLTTHKALNKLKNEMYPEEEAAAKQASQELLANKMPLSRKAQNCL